MTRSAVRTSRHQVRPELVTAGLLVPIAELHNHPDNPRRGNVDMIAESLERFGQVRPLLATPDGTIVAGNHTYRAAVKLGWTHVAALKASLDADDVKAYLIADNRSSDVATNDDAALLRILRELDEAGNLTGTGYAPDDLGALHAALDALDDPIGPEADEPPPLEPRLPADSQPGAVYPLGPHRLVCGDSTNPDALEIAFAGVEGCDLWFTDPPYGVEYQVKISDAVEARARHGRSDGAEIIGDDDPEGIRRLLDAALVSLRPHMKKAMVYYLCAPAGDMQTVFRLALEAAGMPLRQEIVWVKDRFVMGRSDYHYRHESLLYGWKPGAAHYFVDDRTLDTVWEIARPARSEHHPTMKPVELVERAIRNSSRRGDIVFDGFAGSGTTLIAAERATRRAILVEIDPWYADVIRRRWEAYTTGGGDAR